MLEEGPQAVKRGYREVYSFEQMRMLVKEVEELREEVERVKRGVQGGG